MAIGENSKSKSLKTEKIVVKETIENETLSMPVTNSADWSEHLLLLIIN